MVVGVGEKEYTCNPLAYKAPSHYKTSWGANARKEETRAERLHKVSTVQQRVDQWHYAQHAW